MIHLPTLGRSISPRALRLAARAFITRGRGVCTGCAQLRLSYDIYCIRVEKAVLQELFKLAECRGKRPSTA